MTLEIINTVILGMTFLVVLAYTIITRRLHKTGQGQLSELIRQRQLSVIPALLPGVRSMSGSDVFYLTNVGNGIALNVQVKDVPYSSQMTKGNFYRFEAIDSLRPNESRDVPWKSYMAGIEADFARVMPHLKQPPINDVTVTVTISFQDIEGTQYEQVLQMGKNGTRHISLKRTAPT